MSRAYIITGSAGHLGINIVKELESKNCKIYALILPTDDTANLKKTSANIIECDVRDLSTLDSAFSRIKEDEIFVIHAAGIVTISSKVDKTLYDVNVNGTKNIISICKKYNIKRLVYISSVHAIKEKEMGNKITEVNEFSPNKVFGAYAKTKAEATFHVLNSIKEGLDAVIVHPSGIIGPYDNGKSHTVQLIKDYLNNKLFAYVDGGYDFVDVRDVASCVISACINGKCGECYILSGHYITVKNLLENLHDISKAREVKVKLPMFLVKIIAPFMEIYYRIVKQPPLFTLYSLYTLKSNALFSNEKAKHDLNFNPRELKQTLYDTIKWLKEENLVK